MNDAKKLMNKAEDVEDAGEDHDIECDLEGDIGKLQDAIDNGNKDNISDCYSDLSEDLSDIAAACEEIYNLI